MIGCTIVLIVPSTTMEREAELIAAHGTHQQAACRWAALLLQLVCYFPWTSPKLSVVQTLIGVVHANQLQAAAVCPGLHLCIW